MTNPFADSRHLMAAYGQPTDGSAVDQFKLYCGLIDEEWRELNEAMGQLHRLSRQRPESGYEAAYACDVIQVSAALAKETMDVIVVLLGMLHSMGIDAEECWKVVHESNLSKLGPDGRPIYRDDGKVTKGPNYEPPDMISVVTMGWGNAV